MASDAHTDLSRRLAALSPERRVLLHRRLAQTAASNATEEIPLQPRTERRDFPLSSAQRRMWFNHQWNPHQPLYNESFGLRIEGDLKAALLERSFDFVMARHEIFTTTFHIIEGEPRQRLAGCEPPRLFTHDLSRLDEPRREEVYEAESQRLLREPFRLERGPLFRAGLWTMSAGEHRLIFVMHHLIFDGWSGAIFFRELFTTYNSLVKGREPNLPPVRAQYADFAVWEEAHFRENAAALRGQLDYWRTKLAGAPRPPQVPVDHHVPDASVEIAGREVFVCPAAETEALKKLAQESGATLFMALLAVFKLLLARYSGREDILVGLPTVNRNGSALSGIIGVFINTVVLRTDLSGELTFRELLGRVRQTTLEAQANQELPFERLVGALNLKGDAGRSLVRVMFDLQKKTETLVECPGLTIQSLDVTTGLTKFELVLMMEDTGSEIRGVLDYAAERFEAETARQFARHFVALLKAAVARPDMPASHLPLMNSDEIARLEARGQETPEGALALLEVVARASEYRDALAVVDGNIRLSYGQLLARARRLAAVLRQRNIGSGKQVALFLRGGVDLVVSELAVMMAGATFVPIDSSSPAARVSFMIQDCDAVLVITNNESPYALPAWVHALDLDRDRDAIERAELFDGPAEMLCSDAAYLIYTSGSTGEPKGVHISHAALANLVAWHRRVFEVSRTDRATQIAPVGFDASVWEIWPYLAAGASIHFPPRELASDPTGLRDWLVKNRISISFAPTPLAEELVELNWPSDAGLRFLLTGSDRLRKRPSPELPFRLVNNYGPTENTVVATSGLVSSISDGAPPPIGRPIDNVRVRIVDRNLEPVPLGVAGEMLICGRSLANGYWNRPTLTAEKFVELSDGQRAYRTGDICRLRRDGEIEFLGRLDTQVKVRGCRIELAEIEHALLAHEGVRDAVADVADAANGQKRIVAYIVAEAQAAPAPEALRALLAERLPAYMLPSSFVRIDAVPKTANGKVDRKSLPSPDTEELSVGPRIPPRTTTESEIASLWKELLSVDDVSVGDNFFQLGGDSFMASRLVVGIREKFGKELSLARLLSAPTIEACAAFIDGAQPKIAELPRGVIPLKAGSDSLPPLFLVPPASGSPACYMVLANAIQCDRAVYGFEAPGLAGGSTVKSFKAQASKYVEALGVIQPRGPYYLAGWSLGGPVAFEMACQLRDVGQEVAYLGMIDAALPENGRLPGGLSILWPMWWALSYPFTEGILFNYTTFRALAGWVGISLPESPWDVWRRGFSNGFHFMGALLSGIGRSLRVFLANLNGLRNYQPRRFDGAVTLFQTALSGVPRDGGNTLGESMRRWASHVDVYEAPGSHMTLLLDPETASGFAPSFEATLNAYPKRITGE